MSYIVSFLGRDKEILKWQGLEMELEDQGGTL